MTRYKRPQKEIESTIKALQNKIAYHNEQRIVNLQNASSHMDEIVRNHGLLEKLREEEIINIKGLSTNS